MSNPDPAQNPDPSQHMDDRNLLESVLRYIPGFRGYLEKEYRRESDQLARNWMADRLQDSKRGLGEYMRKLVDAAQIDGLPACDRFRARLDGLITRLRGDVQGYSGMFDFVRIREGELDDVYNLDAMLMDDVRRLADSISQLATQNEAPNDVMLELGQHLDDVERKYNQRSDLLQGLSPE